MPTSLGVSAYFVKAHPHTFYPYPQSMAQRNLQAVVAENVKKARLSNKQTQPAVSEAALAKGKKLDQGTISRIERRALSPTVDVLEAVAAGLGINPWELLLPNFDPKNRPVLKEATEAERVLWKKIQDSAKELGLV